jgi:hypothetical protein
VHVRRGELPLADDLLPTWDRFYECQLRPNCLFPLLLQPLFQLFFLIHRLVDWDEVIAS